MTDLSESADAKLALNARGYKPDPVLDAAAAPSPQRRNAPVTPKTKATETAEALTERAERLHAELAALSAEEHRRQQAELERLAQHQEAIDQATVAEYDRSIHDAAVVAAWQALQQTVVEHPLPKALASYYLACSRRREAHDQYIGVLSRQGRDVSGVQHPRTDDIGVRDVLDVMEQTAKTAASDWRIQAEAAYHHRRDNPDESNEEQK